MIDPATEGELIAPETEAELIAHVTEAAAANSTFRICGLDSKRGMLRPVEADRSISTRALSGITLYSPGELVLSARAGTSLQEIEQALTAEGQRLVAEPPDFSGLFQRTASGSGLLQGPASGGGTIGGAVSTNLSGPRRISGGALRDQVLGLRAVNGTGELLRCGGRVLKNVTGLDLCRLLAGSHGTLGIITEVTLKVMPAPQTTLTILLRGLTAQSAIAVMASALGGPHEVSGAAWLGAPGAIRLGLGESSATALRLEGSESYTRRRARTLAARLAALPAAAGSELELLDDALSPTLWRGIANVVPLGGKPDAAIWRLSVPPSEGAAVLATLTEAGIGGFLDWGGGLVWCAGPATAAAHATIMRAAQQAAGTWMLMRAPDALRLSQPVLPPEHPAMRPIARRTKAAMDPHALFNPHRLHREF